MLPGHMTLNYSTSDLFEMVLQGACASYNQDFSRGSWYSFASRASLGWFQAIRA